jgi:hypothetical protein
MSAVAVGSVVPGLAAAVVAVGPVSADAMAIVLLLLRRRLLRLRLFARMFAVLTVSCLFRLPGPRPALRRRHCRSYLGVPVLVRRTRPFFFGVGGKKFSPQTCRFEFIFFHLVFFCHFFFFKDRRLGKQMSR